MTVVSMIRTKGNRTFTRVGGPCGDDHDRGLVRRTFWFLVWWILVIVTTVVCGGTPVRTNRMMTVVTLGFYVRYI